MAEARRSRSGTRPKRGGAGASAERRRAAGERRETARAAETAYPEQLVSAPPICSIAFCPICTLVTAMGEAKPELVEHLVLAGREMLLAMRGLIDARLEGSVPSAKLERLTIE